MANAGFDWLGLDVQHGVIDYTTAFPILQAISTTPTMPFVRVPWNDPPTLMKYLDAGAYGVIVPMINTPEDAKAAVKACRYPPDGYRSFGPNRLNYYAGVFTPEEANREVAVILMIETREALENVEAIAAVDGVDGLYIGPNDLNQALGLPPRADPFDMPHFEAAERIRRACEANGIVPGVHTWGPAIASRWIRQGFKMVMLSNETAQIQAGVRAELAGIAEALAEVEASTSKLVAS
jgi:4-hydroxy-2-oxoheptanedioate aldolase